MHERSQNALRTFLPHFELQVMPAQTAQPDISLVELRMQIRFPSLCIHSLIGHERRYLDVNVDVQERQSLLFSSAPFQSCCCSRMSFTMVHLWWLLGSLSSTKSLLIWCQSVLHECRLVLQNMLIHIVTWGQ